MGLDEHIAGLSGGSLALALVVAVLLGVRHATDPDHLTAMATLIVGDDRHGLRRARRLGLAWGLGHGIPLVALGIPVVLVGHALPAWVHQAAELLIGVLICALAVRLLLRWHAGAFHAHVHSHGGVRHTHPHAHERDHPPAVADAHEHGHEESLGRTPRAAFCLGLLHGIGGSGGLGIVLVGTLADGAPAIVGLVLFAAATACSMAVMSATFGLALARGTLARRLESLVPGMGVASLLFGAWYAAGAVELASYPL